MLSPVPFRVCALLVLGSFLSKKSSGGHRLRATVGLCHCTLINSPDHAIMLPQQQQAIDSDQHGDEKLYGCCHLVLCCYSVARSNAGSRVLQLQWRGLCQGSHSRRYDRVPEYGRCVLLSLRCHQP
uniref:Putative secreted protein n=1 Tax=Anopheles darlingi TaxID=43151 RepID=A0A2M4DCG9_ANODA